MPGSDGGAPATAAAKHGARGAASDDVALFVVGAGRAGLGIATAVHAAGGAVLGVHGRRALDGVPPLGRVTAGDFPPALDGARVVLVAVQDRALDGALAALRARLRASGARPVVLHASGSAEPLEYDALRADGVACGTFHPLVPLARPERAPDLLRDAWIGVDGDADAVRAARALADRVGARTLVIPPGEKGRYHAAAVFASNFPIVLAAIAERLLARAGVAADEARPAVRHLLSSAAANLARGDDAALALTGPVVRGDAETVHRHVAALAADPDVLALYRALSAATLDVARGSGAEETTLAAVVRALDDHR